MSEWKGDKIVLNRDLKNDLDPVEVDYPVMCHSFKDITNNMYELFLKKQADYGPANIGMGNSSINTDKDVEKSMIVLIVRMNDKVQRLMNLILDNKDPQNESIEDTLIDIANYAVMSQLVINKEWG